MSQSELRAGIHLNDRAATNLQREQRAGTLSTNLLSRNSRIQRWANFIAGFSIQFVESCVSTAASSRCALLLDPFLGSGTSLVAARNLGIRGLGYDPHPLFASLARAKLSPYTVDSVDDIQNHLVSSQRTMQWSPQATRFISKMYSPYDMSLMSKAASAVSELSAPQRDLALSIFLDACELSCQSQTDGIYKAPETRKRSVSGFSDSLSIASAKVRDDVGSDWYRHHWSQQPDQQVFQSTSENMSAIADQTVDICATSPPYLNNFDYAEMTRLQLYLLGWASSWREITRTVRHKLITNTTTALNPKRKANDYQESHRGALPGPLREECDRLVHLLREERRTRPGKKEYDYLIYPYYAQILSVLRELFRVMRSNGTLHWIVSDAALYGVHVRTHLHTAVLLEYAGFTNVTVDLLRKRGHRWTLAKRDGAKDGLGEYHIRAVRA